MKRSPDDPSRSQPRPPRVRLKAGHAYRYVVAGQIVECLRCGGGGFAKETALLNSRGLTFMGLDWLNRGAWALICETCSRIEWFAREPQKKMVLVVPPQLPPDEV